MPRVEPPLSVYLVEEGGELWGVGMEWGMGWECVGELGLKGGTGGGRAETRAKVAIIRVR